MPTDILMPALAAGVDMGKLVRWLKNEGDRISVGEAIAEAETDKATVEIEAKDAGILHSILIANNTDGVAVNTSLGILLKDGEAAPAASLSAASDRVSELAVLQSIEKEHASDLNRAQEAPAIKFHGARLFASPLAKRLAKEMQVDLSKLSGTGPHGRILAKDVHGASNQADKLTQVQTSSTSIEMQSGQGATDSARSLFDPETYVEVPHDTMRKAIARRLAESKATVPHFYLTADCHIDHLLQFRETLNNAAQKGPDGTLRYKISVNDLVVKAYAKALFQVPAANVSWAEDAMLQHNTVDVGVAVAIEGGLITPIIRRAHEKSLSTVSNEIKELATRAKSRKLKSEEYQGGTGAISNLGMLGVKSFTAIINPPHATILAVGAGTKQAIVRDGKIVAETVMNLTLSTDHRAVDGALAAQLMNAIKGYIEDPLTLLV
jgi:pyruvate dehydrogenase E2 component (dihydrolipoamide acetyltransferase)